jgi:DNA-binding response OmpR family regulator
MKRILLVEDDALLGFDLAEQLSEAGYRVVGPAVTAQDGLTLIAREGCDCAVLDVNLGFQLTSEPVALALKARAVPFVVVSGYAGEQRPPAFDGAPMIVKPVRFDRLREELARILDRAGAATSEQAGAPAALKRQ